MRWRVIPIVFTFAAAAAPLEAADWPCFRGPNHDGISSDTGLGFDFANPPPPLWERAVGSGFSSFAVVGGKVYTCGTVGEQQVLFCLNEADGAVVWQTPLEREYQERQGGDGPRATPTVDGGKVYVQGALGRLVCADASDGRVLWDKQFSAMPVWGYSHSVLIEGNLAITCAGGDDGALVAFDKQTGKQVWQAGDGGVGYATPYPITLNDKRYIVGFLAQRALVVDASDGRAVWERPWKTDWDVNAAAPIYHDGRLLLSSGYHSNAKVFNVSMDGARLKGEVAWDSKALQNKFQSPVLLGEHLYSGDQNGLHCVEFASGKRAWSYRRIRDVPHAPDDGASFQHSTVVAADGKLWVLTEDGKLLAGPATPSEFRTEGVAQILDGRCWTVPVICNGKLFARNMTRVVCFDLKK